MVSPSFPRQDTRRTLDSFHPLLSMFQSNTKSWCVPSIISHMGTSSFISLSLSQPISVLLPGLYCYFRSSPPPPSHPTVCPSLAACTFAAQTPSLAPEWLLTKAHSSLAFECSMIWPSLSPRFPTIIFLLLIKHPVVSQMSFLKSVFRIPDLH